jgi:hypothetical protein
LIFYDPYTTKDTELYGSFTSDLIPGFWVALYFELARRSLTPRLPEKRFIRALAGPKRFRADDQG